MGDSAGHTQGFVQKKQAVKDGPISVTHIFLRISNSKLSKHLNKTTTDLLPLTFKIHIDPAEIQLLPASFDSAKAHAPPSFLLLESYDTRKSKQTWKMYFRNCALSQLQPIQPRTNAMKHSL